MLRDKLARAAANRRPTAYPLDVERQRRRRLAELVPTSSSKRPGSTTRFIDPSIIESACGPTVKVTVFFAPGSSETRWKPRSSLTGRVTELTTSRT